MRAFLFHISGEEKIINEPEKYELMLSTGEWFTSPSLAKEALASLKTERNEIKEAIKKRGNKK